jgi:hypothetical protein
LRRQSLRESALSNLPLWRLVPTQQALVIGGEEGVYHRLQTGSLPPTGEQGWTGMGVAPNIALVLVTESL